MSEPKEKTYKEYWIHSTGNAYTRDVSSNFPVVHVIEHRAFSDLLADAQKLAKALERAKNNIGDLCISPEKAKWEHERYEIKCARESITEFKAKWSRE